jgi:transcriptional accessory protein Tex/SPT6
VVEDAVNAVGVDLNTASAPLLARVSGLGKSSAERSSRIAMPMARSKAARS